MHLSSFNKLSDLSEVLMDGLDLRMEVSAVLFPG